MIRLLILWVLRRQRDAALERVAWIREEVYSGQIALDLAEKRLRATQARVWAAESARTMLKPGRPAAGVASRRQ
jgi:hypothetical protein